MLEQRAVLVGRRRLKVRILFAGSERRAVQKRHDFIEDGGVAGDLDVVGDGVRQARAGRRRFACERPGPTVEATNAGRRPRGTAGRRRAEDVRA